MWDKIVVIVVVVPGLLLPHEGWVLSPFQCMNVCNFMFQMPFKINQLRKFYYSGIKVSLSYNTLNHEA